MNTLLIRLAAPLQSWGVDSKFERRMTERCPTKSGVIGLVAAALGRQRNEDIKDLNQLRFGVRIDQEGTLLRDYHTAKSEKSAYVTQRFYLSDAVFLVGIEGDSMMLKAIDHALKNPVFPLFLGRRSCPPEGKLSLGVREGKCLLHALQEEPWLVSEWMRKIEDVHVKLRIVVESEDQYSNNFFIRDIPLSFNQEQREYGFRCVTQKAPKHIYNPGSRKYVAGEHTEHDPMLELKGE